MSTTPAAFGLSGTEFLTLQCFFVASANFIWNEAFEAFWARNCDFENDDIGNKVVPAGKCSDVCAELDGCTHFTWTPYGGGTCWMKHKNGITTASAIPCFYPGSFCGILKPRRGAGSWRPFSRSRKSFTRTEVLNPDVHVFSGRHVSFIAGLICDGKFCKTIHLIFVHDEKFTVVSRTVPWNDLSVHALTSWTECPSGSVANGIFFHGHSHCNIKLHCRRPSKEFRVDAKDIKEVGWTSERKGEVLCPDGYYLWGFACSGIFGDGSKLKCARVDYIP